MIRPLGLQSVRAKRLIRLSEKYLEAPPDRDRLYKSNAHTAPPTNEPPFTQVQHDRRNPPPPSPSKRQRYPPTPVSHFPGTGAYALDSYRIFCTSISEPEAWKDVMPTDKELVKFLVGSPTQLLSFGMTPNRVQKWKWAFKERKLWIPGAGVTGSIDIKDLEELIDGLRK